MTIQIYILSKLLEGNNYPYMLKKELSEPIPFDKMAKLSESKLYYHFESLSKQGLIEPKEIIKEENRPDKQVFAITNQGREQLPKKIYELFEKSEKLSDILIGLMFLRHVEKSKVVAILEKKLEKLKGKKSALEALYVQIPKKNSVQEMVEFSSAYLTDMIQNEINWYEKLIPKLQK